VLVDRVRTARQTSRFPVNPLRSLRYFRRRLRLKARHVDLGSDVEIEAGVVIGPGPGTVHVGNGCTLDVGVVLAPWRGSISLDRRVFLGPYTVIYGHGGVTIGEQTLVSMHCRIMSSNHTVPAPGTDIRSQPDILQPTRIGRDVWLGAGVTVLGGVRIGDGCVVGAGAVVSRDLPPNTISMGVPAEVSGARQL